MRCVIELVIGACEFVEQVGHNGRSVTSYHLLHQSSNLTVAIRLVETTPNDQLETLKHDISAIVTERIVPQMHELLQRTDADKIDPLSISLLKFIRVVSERLSWSPNTYAVISQLSFALSRSNSSRVRICGVELATTLLGSTLHPVSVTHHIKRFMELWTTKHQFLDPTTRLSQLGFMSRILCNPSLVPKLTFTHVAKMRVFLLTGTESNNTRVAACACKLLRVFTETFPCSKISMKPPL